MLQEKNIQRKETKEDISAEKLKFLKMAWEKLQKDQKQSFSRNIKRISSVEIVKDLSGKRSVQVNLIGGGRIVDNGNKKNLFKKMTPQRNVNIGRVLHLLEDVRKYGFDAVAMGLSPAMKELLLKACKRCGIPLTPVKQKKANVIKFNTTKDTMFLSEEKASTSLENKLSPIAAQSVMDLPFDDHKPLNTLTELEIVFKQQKQQNDLYCQTVVKRCEERGKDKYFDQMRSRLVEIEKLESQSLPLTNEQKKIKKQALSLGVKTDKNAENLTADQEKNRRNFALRNLPPDIRQEIKANKTRYKEILASKNKAAELIKMSHAKDFQTGHHVCLSREQLQKEFQSLLPDAAHRDTETMKKCSRQLQEKINMEKRQQKKERQEKQKNITNLIQKTMLSSPARTTGLQTFLQQTNTYPVTRRKSFISNAIAYQILQERQNQR